MVRAALEEELRSILDYWANEVYDEDRGFFIGRIETDGRKRPESPLGVVLYSRILWSFSAGYAAIGHPRYKQRADQCYDLLKSYFYDREFGGLYWSVQVNGNPLVQKKQVYGQAFALYGLVEYYKISGHPQVLKEALDLFDLIERHSYDEKAGGYLDALGRNWGAIQDMRLSQKDMNVAKSMNTHLHILEAYSNLYSVRAEGKLGSKIKALLEIFADKIVDKENKHLNLFFNREWDSQSNSQSYGHDIEASWLLREAMERVYTGELPSRLTQCCDDLAQSAAKGLLADGSMANEGSSGHLNKERHWWVQAEAAVGFTVLARKPGNEAYNKIADRLWHYIMEKLKDPIHGEWFWGRNEQDEVLLNEDKAGMWKGPYHSTRACLELMKLILD